MEIIFLGTGAAEGIPSIDCDCRHCRLALGKKGKFIRKRTSLLFKINSFNLLVDTPPDIGHQLIEHNIRDLHVILLTHNHFDHIGGIKEFEYWKKNITLFAEKEVMESVVKEYWTDKLDKIFLKVPCYAGSILNFGSFTITPFPVLHSPNTPTYGFMLNYKNQKIAYLSDAKSLGKYASYLLKDADIIIANTPFFDQSAENHLSTVEAIKLKDDLNAKKLILTHINHYNKPYDELVSYCNQFKDVIVAYDGMKIIINND